jgi:hypothetical protein
MYGDFLLIACVAVLLIRRRSGAKAI